MRRGIGNGAERFRLWYGEKSAMVRRAFGKGKDGTERFRQKFWMVRRGFGSEKRWCGEISATKIDGKERFRQGIWRMVPLYVDWARVGHREFWAVFKAPIM